MKRPASRKLYTHEQATRDLIEIHAYLFERSPRVAGQLIDEARKSFDAILAMPGVGRRWQSALPELADLRVTVLSRRFHDYLVFYRPRVDGIQIVTILHGARDLLPLLNLIHPANKE